MNHKELEKKIRALELFERLETDHTTYQREVGGYSKYTSTTHLFIPVKHDFFDDDIKAVKEYQETLRYLAKVESKVLQDRLDDFNKAKKD